MFNILLQVLDEGHLTDNYGRVIDFKNTVVIMTSNVGARDIMQGKTLGFHGGDQRRTFEKMQDTVKEEMNKVFNPEFLNRLDDVIVFHPLDKDHIAQIVTILLREVQRRLGDEVKLTPAAVEFLVEHGYDQNYGARPLKRSIQRYIEDPLSERILMGDFGRGDEIEVDVAPDGERLAFRALTALRPRAGRRAPPGGRRAHPTLTDASLPPDSYRWPPPSRRAGGASAQEPVAPAVDSIAVAGNARLTPSQIIGTSGIIVHQPINYRDIQRAITALFRTGQFDDVVVEQRNVGGRLVLVIRVKERPLLEKWAVRGVNRLSEGEVKGRVHLTEGRPLDRNAVEQGRAGIDSLYKHQGYYASQVKVLQLPQQSGTVRVVFDVDEGQRVAISQVVVDGNKHFSDKAVVKHMSTRPEGFWWFQKGEYDERKVEQDVRERLPHWYADQGFVDFQVTHDSLVSDSAGGKAVLRLTVDEGPVYRVGKFDLQGNRRFSSEELLALYPFGPIGPNGAPPSGPSHSAAPTGRPRPRRCRTSMPTTATSTPRSNRKRCAAPAPAGRRWWTCAGTSARDRRPRSTRSRSSVTR